MTGNVNFTGNGVYYSPKDIENLAKYATGVAITNKDQISVTEVLTYPLVPTAISGLNWLKQNRGNYTAAFNTIKAESQAAHDVYVSGGNFVNGMKAVSNSSTAAQILGAIPTAEKAAKYSQETQALYNQAKAAAELAKSGSKDAVAKASQLFTEANAAAYAETAANATGWWGKFKNMIGISKAGNAINQYAVKNPTFAKGYNTFKAQGGGMMLAIEGATELITNVVPTFKELGAKSGFKQVGKSSVKTVASVGGWVAGAALGTKIGAAIGSIIPGAGTAVGAVVGSVIGSACSLIGGSLGSRLAKQGAEKVVGKDELVLAQEKQAENIAQSATVDSNVLGQVVNSAAARLNQEGVNSDDARIAYNSLNAISSGNSVVNYTQTPQQSSTTQRTTQPSFQSRTAQQVAANQTNPFASQSQTYPASTTAPGIDLNAVDSMIDRYAAMYGLT